MTFSTIQKSHNIFFSQVFLGCATVTLFMTRPKKKTLHTMLMFFLFSTITTEYVVVPHIRCRSAHVLCVHRAARNLRSPFPHLSGAEKCILYYNPDRIFNSYSVIISVIYRPSPHSPRLISNLFFLLFLVSVIFCFVENPLVVSRFSGGEAFLALALTL